MKHEFDLITIVETKIFYKESRKVLTEDQAEEMKGYLAVNPTAGDLIPGLRGLRKLRWTANQKGKSGGLRVIYFFYNKDMPLFLLDIYTKTTQADLTPQEKGLLNKLIDDLINQYGE
jgi:hypothetical protein